MPSQNLPKPNLPGQSSPVSQSDAVSQLNALTQANAQTVFSQTAPQPQQLQKTNFGAQVVPGGLSRENPGGTPPNMKVAAPAPTLTQEQIVAQNTVIDQNKQPLASISNSRPLGPLDQISLGVKTNSASTSAAATSTAATAQVNQSAQPAQASPTLAPSTPSTPISTPTNIPISTSKSAATSLPAVAPAAAKTPAFTSPAATSKTSNIQPEQIGQTANKATGILSKFKNKKFLLTLLIGGGILLLIILIALLFNSFKAKTNTSKVKTSTNSDSGTTATGNSTGQISTITYWGLWEDSQILKEVIADFESKNPSIKIDYRKQSHRDYRERLQQAILSGNGPDIFRYHVTWTSMLGADLAPMPANVMSVAQYKEIFYPTAYNNLQVGGQIVGIPLMYDGLALFYNKEMLKTANIEVPKTWAELRTAANKLTVPANPSERSNLVRAGLAIGNAGNVDHFSDILALLIIQNGGNPAEATSQYVKDAITFYTNFVKQDKVWSDRLANSTTAFAKGDVAMIFAPSWRIHDIKAINPQLDFAVARVPQLNSESPVSWATFWAEGVSNKSKNKEAAWAFLKYLSTPEVLRKFYNSASQYRAFGEIYPRIDMTSELQNSDTVAAYVEDAPLAKTWSMASFTHDNGINDQIIKYYEDAVNAVLSGADVNKALETTKTGISTVISKYSSSK